MNHDVAYQQCMNIGCKATFSVTESLFACPKCGSLLDIRYEWDRINVPKKLADFGALGHAQ